MNTTDRQHRTLLRRIARQAMIQRGLLPEFSPEALAQLDEIKGPGIRSEGPERDLRHLLWCSIDNDDSRDLDQITFAQEESGRGARVLVAVADVDALVKKDTAIDRHARQNTTTVYTEAETFPMLPERLSTNLTSLNYASERYAVVVDMTVSENGTFEASEVYIALVRNHAKLAYNSVAAWLENSGPMPKAIEAVSGLAENLRLQDRLAQRMKTVRHVHGALTLETMEARLVFEDGALKAVEAEKKNRAKDIIEDFMIAANGVTARFLSSKNLPSLRRVVRIPKRWGRIVELASEHGFALSAEPDSKALERFLMQVKVSDPLRYPDLCVSVIKLMGPGEYTVELPGERPVGHFGLAVKDYTHSTAPNRRYSDVVTQRLLKAAIHGFEPSYEYEELSALAKQCTEKEDAAKKIERHVKKSAAAMLLEARIGERFDAIVTGAAPKGTWVRLLHSPIEGKLVVGFEGLDVGHRVRVQLLQTDVERGFIDFKRVD